MKDCDHDLLYSGEFFASNPPRYFFLCKKCGHTGVNTEKPNSGQVNREEFNELKKIFEHTIK
jgi:hypothetical protein